MSAVAKATHSINLAPRTSCGSRCSWYFPGLIPWLLAVRYRRVRVSPAVDRKCALWRPAAALLCVARVCQSHARLKRLCALMWRKNTRITANHGMGYRESVKVGTYLFADYRTTEQIYTSYSLARGTQLDCVTRYDSTTPCGSES